MAEQLTLAQLDAMRLHLRLTPAFQDFMHQAHSAALEEYENLIIETGKLKEQQTTTPQPSFDRGWQPPEKRDNHLLSPRLVEPPMFRSRGLVPAEKIDVRNVGYPQPERFR